MTLEGAAFDQTYLDAMVKGHANTLVKLDTFEDSAKAEEAKALRAALAE